MDTEKQQIERGLAQNKAVSLSGEHKHLLLTWATGVGKGKAVAMCMKASTSPKRWLVVVPEILQVENYKNDLIKHGFGWMLRGDGNGVSGLIEDVICYASIKKYKGRELNLALNEVHKLSDMRWDIAKSIQFDQIVSDSATVPASVKTKLWELCPYFEYHISLNDAIERGILPEPKIFLVGVDLDNTVQRNVYWIKTRQFQVTDKEYNAYLERQNKYWEDRANREHWPKWILNRINQMGSIRKKFLAERKTEKVKEILSTIGEKRYIVYCGSINQAILLGGKNAIHSKRTPSVNKKTLEKFNDYEINSLYMMKMGREGLNFDGIECVIVAQLDSGADNSLSFIQITGRGMRAEFPEIYIIYIKESQDAVYKDRAIKNIDKKYIIKL